MTTALIHTFVSSACVSAIDEWVAKYPANEKQSAVLSALLLIQDELGYLSTDVMDAVAQYLDMPSVSVYEVVSFYTMYEVKPTGRHIINVCTNVSCKLRGCDEIVAAIENKIGAKLGSTSEDGRFSLRSVECLGACVQAPMMQINKTYHEYLTVSQLDEILEQYT